MWSEEPVHATPRQESCLAIFSSSSMMVSFMKFRCPVSGARQAGERQAALSVAVVTKFLILVNAVFAAANNEKHEQYG